MLGRKLKNRAIRLIAIALFCGALLLSTKTMALSFDHEPLFTEIANEAALIFHGKVKKVTNYIYTDPSVAMEFPYTEVTYSVITPIKNVGKKKTIILYQFGGYASDGDTFIHAPGVSQFKKGEEVIVFSNELRHPLWGAIYGNNGVFRVVTEGDGSKKVLTEEGYLLVFEPPETQFTFLPSVVCVPDETAPTTCSDWLLGGSGTNDNIEVTPIDGEKGGSENSAANFEEDHVLVTLDLFIAHTKRVLVPYQETEIETKNKIKFLNDIKKLVDNHKKGEK